MDWENHLEKKSNPKIEKTVKINVILPNVNKKPLSRKKHYKFERCKGTISPLNVFKPPRVKISVISYKDQT